MGTIALPPAHAPIRGPACPSANHPPAAHPPAAPPPTRPPARSRPPAGYTPQPAHPLYAAYRQLAARRPDARHARSRPAAHRRKGHCPHPAKTLLKQAPRASTTAECRVDGLFNARQREMYWNDSSKSAQTVAVQQMRTARKKRGCDKGIWQSSSSCKFPKRYNWDPSESAQIVETNAVVPLPGKMFEKCSAPGPAAVLLQCHNMPRTPKDTRRGQFAVGAWLRKATS